MDPTNGFPSSPASVSPLLAVVYTRSPQSLLLIEHGERHEVRNTGRSVLKTLNFYPSPAYTESGDELPAAKQSSWS